MKKFICSLLMTFMSICCFASFVSVSEAASVAILPLIYNAEDREEDATRVFYTATMQCIKQTEGYSLVDNDSMTEVIDKNFEADKVPTEQVLRDIANQSGVDIVIAMQVDKLQTKEQYSIANQNIFMDLQGYSYSYNALTGKFNKHRIFDDTVADVATVVRTDFAMRVWGNNVKREMNRILGVKKIKVEKPRLGW